MWNTCFKGGVCGTNFSKIQCEEHMFQRWGVWNKCFKGGCVEHMFQRWGVWKKLFKGGVCGTHDSNVRCVKKNVSKVGCVEHMIQRLGVWNN